MRSFPPGVCAAAVLLLAALVPRTAGAAAADQDQIPASPRRTWDANGLFATASPSSSDDNDGGRGGGGGTAGAAACPLKLRPAGQCGGSGGDEDCPYQITLPPLTVQLPKQFRLLEKTMKELQSLKETVHRLKSECRAAGGGGGAGAGNRRLEQYQADQGQVRVRVQAPPGGDGGAEARGTQPGQEAAGIRAEERGDGTVVEGAATGGTVGPGPGQDSGTAGTGSGEVTADPFAMQEMQAKMNRMSISLRNARKNISTLQGRLENLNLVNMHNVQSIVDNRVENITEVVNKLKSSCNTYCPVHKPGDMILAPRDCSDYAVVKERNGVYQVIPDRAGGFSVACDMESFGGGWTVIQQRLNGSVSFNRTWAEYKEGFGNLRGEFWLGNDHIHQLTKSKDMILRIELEDFEGVREYAKYDQFYVANEFLLYRLSISGYSGTAGNAISFNKHFNHDQKFFTTPDRDNDMYPSGNCGAYYSSGWWFDACMSANLNGKYYHKRYKGVRNGIFWGTWHNQTTEYYPTNYRQAFKTVKMMIRPKNYAP